MDEVKTPESEVEIYCLRDDGFGETVAFKALS